MAVKLDPILVVDTEATCWEGAIPLGEETQGVALQSLHSKKSVKALAQRTS